jgi:hypothetical protein
MIFISQHIPQAPDNSNLNIPLNRDKKIKNDLIRQIQGLSLRGC